MTVNSGHIQTADTQEYTGMGQQSEGIDCVLVRCVCVTVNSGHIQTVDTQH